MSGIDWPGMSPIEQKKNIGIIVTAPSCASLNCNDSVLNGLTCASLSKAVVFARIRSSFEWQWYAKVWASLYSYCRAGIQRNGRVLDSHSIPSTTLGVANNSEAGLDYKPTPSFMISFLNLGYYCG